MPDLSTPSDRPIWWWAGDGRRELKVLAQHWVEARAKATAELGHVELDVVQVVRIVPSQGGSAT